MGVTRTPFAYRIDTWTPDGESIVEHRSMVHLAEVALASAIRSSRVAMI